MDIETYHRLGLDTPFEEKPRTKRDSGMQNINGGPTRKDQWMKTLAAEDAARRKYPTPAIAQPRPGVPPGRYIEHKAWSSSRVYPGTQRDWCIWVPPQYDGRTPASLAIFNDGLGFLQRGGPVRATVVLGNLITDGLLDVTIAVFLNPGLRPGHPDCVYDRRDPQLPVADDPQRSLEYDTVSGTYARFLLEDILPVVESDFRIARDPTRRALIGISSGAVGAFCSAWFRPDAFGRVASICGSFVNIRGAHNLPWLIRNTARKPIRVFLLSGEHDMNNNHGSWPLANQEMASALEYAGYSSRFVFGTGGHGMAHAGSIFPSIIEWLFKDTATEFAEQPRVGRLLGTDSVSKL